MKKNESSSTKTRGVPSKQAITLRYQAHAEESLDVLLEIMRNKDSQDSVRMAAASKILDKVIPDVKAVEVTGENHGPIEVRIIEEKITTSNE